MEMGSMLREIFSEVMAGRLDGHLFRYERPKGLPRGMDLRIVKQLHGRGAEREFLCTLEAKPSKYTPHTGDKQRRKAAARLARAA